MEVKSPESKYKKLNVVELRKILSSRGQEFKGLRKKDLVLKCLETESDAAPITGDSPGNLMVQEIDKGILQSDTSTLADESECLDSSAEDVFAVRSGSFGDGSQVVGSGVGNDATHENHPAELTQLILGAESDEAMEIITKHSAVEPSAEQDTATESILEQDTISQSIEELEAATEPMSEHDATAQPIAERDTVTQPIAAHDTVTQPIAEQDTVTQPIAEQDTVTRPIAEQDTVTQPITEQDTITQPIADQDTDSQPIGEQDTASEPIAAQDTASEPVAVQDTASEPIAEQDTASEPIAAQDTASEPIEAQDTASEPIAEQDTASEPIEAQDTASESIAVQDTASEPIAVQDTASEPIAEQDTASEPIEAQNTASEPIAAQDTASRPLAVQDAYSLPIAEQDTSQPIAEHDTSQPIAEQDNSQPIAEQGTSHPIAEQDTSQPIVEQDDVTEPIAKQQISTAEPMVEDEADTLEVFEQSSSDNAQGELAINVAPSQLTNSQAELAASQDVEITPDSAGTLPANAVDAQEDSIGMQETLQEVSTGVQSDSAKHNDQNTVSKPAGVVDSLEVVQSGERIGPHTPKAEEPMDSETTESSHPVSDSADQSAGGVFSMIPPTVGESEEKTQILQVEEPNAKKLKKEWKYDPEPVVMEGTAWVDSEVVQLDRFHCDLNMTMKKDGFSCSPLSRAGFGYMWAGARANYGVSSPCSVAFQVKVTEALPINVKEQPFGSNFVARVGWSIDSMNFQLGESPYSFGYQSTGRCCCDSQFVDYGESYGIGDVITCYLEISDLMVTISFSKNNEPVVQAYKLESHLLGDHSLFPHISSKNFSLDVDFGQRKKRWCPINGEYIMISDLEVARRDRAAKPPSSKPQCDVLLMVGMVGAGKSHWVAQKIPNEPAKRWNIIGTPELLSKMKVEGCDVSQCYNGRWDDLFDKTNTCLKKLLPIAASKLRNYIIDQTNVYEGAQCRKVRPFKGFTRKAIIVVPSDDVYQQRLEERDKTANKSVHIDAILEMKANFHIPKSGVKFGQEHSFHEIVYAELPAEQVQKLIAQYNVEGQVRYKKISKQYHKREQKAQQRKVDLAKLSEKKGQGGIKRTFEGISIARGDGTWGIIEEEEAMPAPVDRTKTHVWTPVVKMNGSGGTRRHGVQGGMVEGSGNPMSHITSVPKNNMITNRVGSSIPGTTLPTNMTRGHMMQANMAQGNVMQGGNMMQRNMMQGNMAQGSMMQGNMARGNMMQGNMARGNVAQGIVAQGNVMQGIVARGNVAQGNVAQGNVAQGIVAQGNVMQGIVARGNVAQGIVAQGNVAQGNVAQGIVAQGNVAQGNVAQGIVAQGNVAQGNVAQGKMMQGNVAPGSMMQGNVAPGSMMQGNVAPGSMTQGNMMQGNVAPGSMTQGNMMQGNVAQGNMMGGNMVQRNMMGGNKMQSNMMQGNMMHNTMQPMQAQFDMQGGMMTNPSTEGGMQMGAQMVDMTGNMSNPMWSQDTMRQSMMQAFQQGMAASAGGNMSGGGGFNQGNNNWNQQQMVGMGGGYDPSGNMNYNQGGNNMMMQGGGYQQQQQLQQQQLQQQQLQQQQLQQQHFGGGYQQQYGGSY